VPGPLALLLLTLPAAQAGAPMVMAHPSLPPRPTTFLVDDKVSGGRVENVYPIDAKIGARMWQVHTTLRFRARDPMFDGAKAGGAKAGG
jgi:hypothetical protein